MRATIKWGGLHALVLLMVASVVLSEGVTTTAARWDLVSKDSVVTVTTNGPSVTANLPIYFSVTTSATLAPVPPVGGSFTGNYSRVKASALGLNVTANFAMSAESYVRLVPSTVRRWARYSLTNGVNQLLLDRVDGQWVPMFVETNDATLDANWAEDMQKVAGISVHLKRNNAAPGTHTITVSNFHLVSDRPLGAPPDTLEQALMKEFNKASIGELSDAELAEDDDVDGMTDLDEILSEIDPCGQSADFAAVLFEADVVSVGDGTAEISFACVGGESYTIYRSLTIGGAATVVGTRYPIETGFDSITDTAAGSGAAFYTIRQNCP